MVNGIGRFLRRIGITLKIVQGDLTDKYIGKLGTYLSGRLCPKWSKIGLTVMHTVCSIPMYFKNGICGVGKMLTKK